MGDVPGHVLSEGEPSSSLRGSNFVVWEGYMEEAAEGLNYLLGLSPEE